jgi:hypothetical protein
VVPCQLPVRLLDGILACFSPLHSVSSAVIIWCPTTSPVADANASSPSLIAPVFGQRHSRFERQVGQSDGLFRVGSAHAETFFFTVVRFLEVLGRARSLPAGGSPAGDPPYFNDVRDKLGEAVDIFGGAWFAGTRASDRPFGRWKTGHYEYRQEQ